MKKILLTMGVTLTFAMVSFAQQDTTRTQSNQYRETQPAEQTVDSAANQINEEAREQGQNFRQEADSTGNQLKRDAENAGDTVMNELEKAGNEVQSEVEKAEEGIKRSTNSNDQMNQNNSSTQSANSQNMDASSHSPQPGAAVEVLDSKEGPNNEVVYKFNGELYIVDRQEKKLVKVKESDLKDTNHEVMIHEGTATEKETSKTTKSKG